MPYPDDGELRLWGHSQQEGAVRLRFPDSGSYFLERLENGAWRHLTYNTGAGAISVGAAGIVTTSGAGTAGGTNVTAVERIGHLRETVVTFASEVIDTVDAGANGAHGSLKFYDLPEGTIQIMGATCDLTTLAGAGGIADDAALVGSVGTATVGTDNALLGGAEANVIPSIAGTLSSGAGDLHGKTTAQEIATIHDGTSTPIDLYLNLAIPAAASSADDTVTISGTITILWAQLGDH